MRVKSLLIYTCFVVFLVLTGCKRVQGNQSQVKNREELKKVSIISDIDDTLKITGIKSGYGIVAAMYNNESFFYLSELYQYFFNNDSSNRNIYYLTGAPSMLYIKNIAELFLTKYKFPQKKNFFNRPSIQDDTAEFKTKKITEIFNSSAPETKYLLIGDNGERDIYAYNAVEKQNPEKILKTFIHFMYLPNNENDNFRMLPNQLAYYTAVDLAQSFYSIGLITLEQLNDVVSSSLIRLATAPDIIVSPWLTSTCKFFLNKLWPNYDEFNENDESVRIKIETFKKKLAELPNCL